MKFNKLIIKIGFNTGVQLAGKVISVFLSFFTVLLMTRYLGAAGYGIFTLAFTYVSFFSVIADFGLQSTMVRELSQRDHDEKQHGNFLFLKILLVILSSLCALIMVLFFPYPYSVKVAIFIATIAVAISGISSFGNVVFQSRLRLDLITLVDVITKIVTVGFIVFFVNLKLNLYFIISTVLFGNIIGLGITFIILKDTFRFFYDSAQVQKILSLSFPVGISSFLGLAYFKVDTIMLSIIKTNSDVGLYSLSYKVLENLLIIWGFYMATVYPLLAKFKGKDDIKQMKSLFRNSFIVALFLSLFIIVSGIIFAPLIIDIFGGKAFYASIPSLKILLFALPFLFINNLCSDFFIIQKLNIINITGILISLLVNILLNLWLIPIYGFIGASYVTVFSALFLCLYYIIEIVIFNNKLAYV